jgi:uncharacterized membrane protein YoaK (UPF0700 family)
MQAYFKEEIGEDMLLEAELLGLSFATGIEDSITFPDFHCFVSNQTGNTVLLSVGAAKIGSTIVILPNTAMSLAAFVIGGWIMGQIGNYYGCYRRGWLFASSIIQTLLVFAALGLGRWKKSVEPTGPMALAVIALLAISSGGQVAMVRSIQMTEITTANATSAYVDTFIDVRLYETRNRPRNRRMLFLVCICAGSFVGAFIHKRWGSSVTLLICALGKTVTSVSLLFNEEGKRKMVEEEDESDSLRTDSIEIEKEDRFQSEFSSQRFTSLSPPSLPLPSLAPTRLPQPRISRGCDCEICNSRDDWIGDGNKSPEITYNVRRSGFTPRRK